MRYETRQYRHFGSCLILTNDSVECIVSLTFGPRVLSFRLLDGENVFFEQPGDADYLCTEDGWRVYGGTRLWLAPESVHDDYYPDNHSVQYTVLEESVTLWSVPDPRMQVQKTIQIAFCGASPALRITYAIRNLGQTPIEGAPWAVTMMREGTVLKAPFSSDSFSAAPMRNLSLWNDTSLADPRLRFGDNWIAIHQIPCDRYFKIGWFCQAGLVQCKAGDQVFTKQFDADRQGTFPDGNVNLEVFCCRWMMEVETLGHMQQIAPGETVAHTEKWSICHTPD